MAWNINKIFFYCPWNISEFSIVLLDTFHSFPIDFMHIYPIYSIHMLNVCFAKTEIHPSLYFSYNKTCDKR